MKAKDWNKWLGDKNIEKYNYASFVGYEDGYFTVLLESFDNKNDKNKVKLVWENIYSYMETNESYREDCWLDEGEDYWPFYKLEESLYLSFFKTTNVIYQDEEIYHYMIIGEEVVDVLAGSDPLIYFIEEKKELINEFSEVYGDYVDKINGQTRLGYSHSDIEEFYELEEIINHHGHYLGSVIRFHDFETGQV